MIELLAQELIDKIVDHVSMGDNHHNIYCSGTWFLPNRVNLKSCALVSRTFLVPSQRCLFSSFNLERQAVAGLPQSPHLASYVRDLLIDLGTGTASALETFLPLFSRVSRVVVKFGYHPWDAYDVFDTVWSSDAWRMALLTLFRLPTLRCFGLSHCDGVPISFIRHALASCREVSLSNVRICTDSPGPFLDRTQLETLRLSSFATPLDRLTVNTANSDPEEEGPPSLPHALIHEAPSSLKVDIPYLELFVQAQRSLSTYAIFRDLQALVVDLGGPLDCHLIDLPNLPGLRSLKLRAYIPSWTLSVPIYSTISILPARTPNIEKLTLVIDGNTVGKPIHPHVSALVWDALKELTHLREVHFRISCAYAKTEFGSGFDSLIQAGLPEAYKAGLLTFSRRCWCRHGHPMRHFSNRYY
ncbi:hypothetical protein B0H14DRAFT_2714698 [Mycena olivaceomarginata]|nr:hypothetical protein B0H14DRAFT_2714698 [Mycena olivaceomarginata]